MCFAEAVPKPTLKLKLLQLNSSGLSCKVSVNCSVRDSWVSGTCDQVRCSQIHLSPGSDVDLSVESDNGTIFCTGSNGVSRETQSEPLTSVCVKPPAPYFTTWGVLIGGVVVLVAALICGALIYKQKCSQKTSKEKQSPVYAPPEESKPHHGVNGSQETPLTVYSSLTLESDQKAQTKVPPSCGGDISMYSEVKKRSGFQGSYTE
ncbi:hypothetical protein GN956_G25684 [Arapaima gigas]